nr:lasso peptide biosynthesis B2 protein [Wenzhouxiangella sp. XN79A]
MLFVWALLPFLGIKRLQPGPPKAATPSEREVEQTTAPGARTSSREVEPWETRARAIHRIATRLPNCRCLPRSLTLARWMASEGLDPELKMGYRPASTRDGASEPLAHAWIELDGVPIGETEESLAGLLPLSWPTAARASRRWSRGPLKTDN